MYSHVMLGATDIEASKKFYDAVLGDPTAPFARLEAYRDATAADIRVLARQIFARSRRTQVRVVPARAKGAA